MVAKRISCIIAPIFELAYHAWRKKSQRAYGACVDLLFISKENEGMNIIFFGLAAYLVGSVSFAVVISKLFGLADPRTYGSHNPGATNVLRSGNKAAAVVTLLGDGAKGWFAVWLALHYGPSYGIDDNGIAVVALAVFIGHLWPVFFRFVGGKGVATALGVLLGLNPWLGAATLVTWLAVAFAFRYSSLAALVASLFAPFYYGLLFGLRIELLAVILMSGLLIYRHRKNIANLLAGKESRIGGGKSL
jgi:acyl phosphate:glycerol-3-phosphate acyltransferase